LPLSRNHLALAHTIGSGDSVKNQEAIDAQVARDR
jgi:hypothetical protein